MAPTLSQTLGYYEREENPSILATGQDDFDFADDWNEQFKQPTSRWRNSCPDKKSSVSTARWSSRLSSLSSSMLEAGSALTMRAKQLGVGESTQRVIRQLRRSMIEVPSRSLKGSMPVQHRFSEVDIDRFDDLDDQPESEKAGDEDGEANEEDTLKKFHASKSWIQGWT